MSSFSIVSHLRSQADRFVDFPDRVALKDEDGEHRLGSDGERLYMDVTQRIYITRVSAHSTAKHGMAQTMLIADVADALGANKGGAGKVEKLKAQAVSLDAEALAIEERLPALADDEKQAALAEVLRLRAAASTAAEDAAELISERLNKMAARLSPKKIEQATTTKIAMVCAGVTGIRIYDKAGKHPAVVDADGSACERYTFSLTTVKAEESVTGGVLHISIFSDAQIDQLCSEIYSLSMGGEAGKAALIRFRNDREGASVATLEDGRGESER